jgi:hypothetical protein
MYWDRRLDAAISHAAAAVVLGILFSSSRGPPCGAVR